MCLSILFIEIQRARILTKTAKPLELEEFTKKGLRYTFKAPSPEEVPLILEETLRMRGLEYPRLTITTPRMIRAYQEYQRAIENYINQLVSASEVWHPGLRVELRENLKRLWEEAVSRLSLIHI